MIETIKTYCEELITEFDLISPDRKLILSKIAEYARKKRASELPVYLIYICTHNSRRSHFGQIWSRVAADFYGMENVHTFSGGTEATAFNTNAIGALKRVGFDIEVMQEGVNPVYRVRHGREGQESICFSKVYDHSTNPQSSFVAIMTCSDAEENCPFIPGVEMRIATTYEDPKAFDNTPLQDSKYDERCRQIARETMYVFSLV